MKKSFLILFIFLSGVNNAHSQNKIIQGKVIDRCLESLIGISIFINDSVYVGETDFDGHFIVEIPSSVNKLSFGGVGWEQTYLVLADDCSVIELIMIEDGYYDMSLYKTDKRRRKEYKELSKIHKKAYKQGIFSSPEACYVQVFRKYLQISYMM